MTDVTTDTRHFSVAYRLGYSTGYDVGLAHGADDAYERVQSVLTGCTSAWNSPRQDDLRTARDEVITTPCRQKCQKCSRCIRYLGWWRNGQRDFAGVANHYTSAVAS